MSAEEFTDTVFSKIDINGDGEEAGVGGGDPQGRGHQGVGLQPQSWILGILGPVSGSFACPFTAPSPGIGLSPSKDSQLWALV